jgi:hypothetical protein
MTSSRCMFSYACFPMHVLLCMFLYATSYTYFFFTQAKSCLSWHSTPCIACCMRDSLIVALRIGQVRPTTLLTSRTSPREKKQHFHLTAASRHRHTRPVLLSLFYVPKRSGIIVAATCGSLVLRVVRRRELEHVGMWVQ